MIPTGSYNQRYVRFGNAEISAADAARFWAKVDRAPNGCWLWKASVTPKGYGQFAIQLPGAEGKQKNLSSHRVAWTVSHGLVPKGMHVLHKCDVRRCCNPDHLFLGTHLDNMQDAAQKGRLHVQRPCGHKLTDAQCEEALALRGAGMKLQAIADRYGVSKGFICALARGRARRYRPQVPVSHEQAS